MHQLITPPHRQIARKLGSHRPAPARAAIIRSEEEALQVAQQLAAQFRPGASRRDRLRELPHEEVRAMARSGLLAITVPKEYGGADVSTFTLAEVFRILSAADGSLGQIPQNHFVFVEAIRAAGTPWQKRFFFRRFLEGEHLGNALKEPDMHTKDGLNIKTQFTRTTGGYLINGRKTYCTGALFAPWIPVFLADEQKRPHVAYVPHDAPGLTIQDDWSGMGQRTTASGTTLFDHVFVPSRFVVLRYKAEGKSRGQNGVAQIMHAAIDAGIAEEALNDTIEFIRTRARVSANSGTERHAEEPYVIRRIGELALQLHSAQALIQRASVLLDRTRKGGTEEDEIASTLAVGEARFAADSAALTIATDLFALNGATSALDEFNLDRHWRNARTHTLHDPPYWKTFNLGNFLLNGEKPRGF